MDDLLSEFLVETSDRLADLDAEIERFAADPGNEQTREALARLFHTIKGASGFLSLVRLEAIAQACENVLAAMPGGGAAANIGAEATLAAISATKRILRGIATTGTEPAGDDGALLSQLSDAIPGDRTPIEGLATRGPSRSELPNPVGVASDDAANAAAQPSLPEEQADRLPAPSADVAVTQAPSANAAAVVERFGTFANLVGELVLTRNNLEYLMRSRDDAELEESVQKLSHVTSDLGANVIATRRQAMGADDPINDFDIVRALTVECGVRRFAIAQRSVSELVWVTPSGSMGTVNDEFRYLRLRDRRLPWIRLSTLLQIEADRTLARRREIVVMVHAGPEHAFGLSVERVFDAEEILVRPQPPVLGTVALYCGNAILGDGSVAMVLDPAGVYAELLARQQQNLAERGTFALPREQ